MLVFDDLIFKFFICKANADVSLAGAHARALDPARVHTRAEVVEVVVDRDLAQAVAVVVVKLNKWMDCASWM